MATQPTTKASVFETLAAINCNEHIEKKSNGKVELSYLSWAWAWHYVKSQYPTAFYTIYETPEGRPYFDDGRTAWVKTGVTIEGQEHIEYLPIMDYKNMSIPVDRITSMDMNKAIQRSLTKAAARHGLGLYIYAGEDLPLSEEEAKAQEALQAQQPAGTQRKINRTVKKTGDAAPAPQEAAPAAAVALTPSQLAGMVKASAEGKLSKSGIPYRDAYIQMVHPTEDELAAFDVAVMNYRIDHNLPAQQ